MTPDAQRQFPAQAVTLKDGAPAIVRPLAETDGPALAALYAAIPPEDERFYCPHPLDREHAFANAARAASPLEVVLVLETDAGRFAGYAWFRWTEAGAATSVFGICLRRAYQGLGAGRLLMARVNEIARAIGPPRMALTVQQANPRAVALYRAMGFVVVREQLRPAKPERGWDAEPEYGMERAVR